jgi:hypothetical protein
MPTIGTFIQLLPKGFKTARYRATDATVFAAIEGKGRTRIGDQTFEWGARDLFVVPSWHWVTHEATGHESPARYSPSGRGFSFVVVIPGWSEGPDPESRDSGFDASHRPGMTKRLTANAATALPAC